MPDNVTPKKVQNAVKQGVKRLQTFQAARLAFIKAFAGQYYGDTSKIGDEPINMIFNAASIIVPTLVSNFPKNKVTANFTNYEEYAELLALGLDYTDKKIDLRGSLRRWIVDSLFTMGIMKVGIASGQDLVTFGDNTNVDAGQLYADVVDFSDWVLDPACTRIEEASFVGHRARVPRGMLMDSGLFNNELVEKLDPYGQSPNTRDRVSELSMHGTSRSEVYDLQDIVEVIELWIPAAKAIVTIPADGQTNDEFLRVEDYYGPDDGPYVYLSLTPPVPNNPLPIAPVGIWYDLHVMANKMMKKTMDQADRQKTVLAYAPSATDDAQELADAADGEAIQVGNVEGMKTFSWGGQEQSNEAHLAQLSYWFSMMSGNTDQLGGLSTGSDTATGQKILAGNQSVRIEDMRDIVYLGSGQINKRLAWYLHTDPLINLPLTKRQKIPAQMQDTPYGPIPVTAPSTKNIQVMLTPEMRRGDFLDYNFEIESKSMSRLDPAMQSQKALMFASRVVPAVAAASDTLLNQGIPFSAQRFLNNMANDMDIPWLEDCFLDPEMQARALRIQAMLPDMIGSQGQAVARPASDRQKSVGGINGGQQQMGRGMEMDMSNPKVAQQSEAAEAQSAYSEVY